MSLDPARSISIPAAAVVATAPPRPTTRTPTRRPVAAASSPLSGMLLLSLMGHAGMGAEVSGVRHRGVREYGKRNSEARPTRFTCDKHHTPARTAGSPSFKPLLLAACGGIAAES